MQKIPLFTFFLLAFSSWVYAESKNHPVTIRSQSSSVLDYYNYLRQNPSTMSPIAAFEASFKTSGIAEALFEKADRLAKIKDTNEKTEKIEQFLLEIYKYPPSYERHHLITSLLSPKEVQEMDPQILNTFSFSIEENLRRLRKSPGGEDLELYVDHHKWETSLSKVISQNHRHTWTLISSSWAPCSVTTDYHQALSWLKSVERCPYWIDGHTQSYKWTRLSFLDQYKREIFWGATSVTPDNWFNPNNIIAADIAEPKLMSGWQKWILTAAILSSIHFMYQNKDKEIVIQLE